VNDDVSVRGESCGQRAVLQALTSVAGVMRVALLVPIAISIVGLPVALAVRCIVRGARVAETPMRSPFIVPPATAGLARSIPPSHDVKCPLELATSRASLAPRAASGTDANGHAVVASAKMRVSFHFALTLGALVLHVGYPVDNLLVVRRIGDQRSAGDVGYLAPAVGDDDSRAGDTDHAVPRDDALGVMFYQRPDFRGDLGGVAPEGSVGVRSWKRDQHEVPALPDRGIGNGLALEIRHVKVRNEIAWSEHVGPDW
jgi:hypothetical protein